MHNSPFVKSFVSVLAMLSKSEDFRDNKAQSAVLCLLLFTWQIYPGKKKNIKEVSPYTQLKWLDFLLYQHQNIVILQYLQLELPVWIAWSDFNSNFTYI